MRYNTMVEGIFRSRPNRFIAHVEIGGTTEICHVKNTGRCRELLPPGAKVWCQVAEDPKRKTKFDLITVRKGDRLINMDSQAPNVARPVGACRRSVAPRPVGLFPSSLVPRSLVC